VAFAKIPIDELIALIASVEAAYPAASPRNILTQVRLLYYSDFAFGQLIPEAQGTQVLTPAGRSIDKAPAATVARLKEKADENGSQDNPSPYFVSGSDEIDLGHVVLGLEALLSANVGAPFSVYSVPRLDPASWIADLGIACVWARDGTAKGTVSPEATAKMINTHAATLSSGTPPEPEPWFVCSAPRQDLIGDVDFFGLHLEWDGTKKLSEVFTAYYKGAGLAARWTRFKTHAQNSWAFGTPPSPPIADRVDRFAQLFAAGAFGAAGSTLAAGAASAVDAALSPFGVHPLNPSPARITFPKTPAYITRFMTWVGASGVGNP
jgi:hypothetical protein